MRYQVADAAVSGVTEVNTGAEAFVDVRGLRVLAAACDLVALAAASLVAFGAAFAALGAEAAFFAGAAFFEGAVFFGAAFFATGFSALASEAATEAGATFLARLDVFTGAATARALRVPFCATAA